MKQVVFSILITLISFLKSNGQDIEKTFQFANSLYEIKEYKNAIEAYRRVLFFDSTGFYSPLIYHKIADCLYETSAFSEAANYYELAYFSEQNDSIKNEVSLKKISCHLIEKEYEMAQEELLSMENKLPNEQAKTKLFYEGILNFALEDYSTSEQSFKQLANDTLAIHNLFRKNEKVSKINPKKAKVMSMIIPGLGQFYAGDIKNGINSLVLTTGLFYLGVRMAINTTFIESAITIMPWFQRYYTGGFQKAEIIATERKQQKRYQIYNQVLDELGK